MPILRFYLAGGGAGLMAVGLFQVLYTEKWVEIMRKNYENSNKWWNRLWPWTKIVMKPWYPLFVCCGGIFNCVCGLALICLLILRRTP